MLWFARGPDPISQLLVAAVAHRPVAVRLQAQNQACSAAAAFHSTGVKGVPLCEPSQNGCVFERPQAHHQ